MQPDRLWPGLSHSVAAPCQTVRTMRFLIRVVVNAFLLWLTAWLTSWWSWGLRVEDFWWGVLAAIIITLINWVFGIIFRPRKD